MDVTTLVGNEILAHAPRVRINYQSVGDAAYVIGLRFDCACGDYAVSDGVSYATHLRSRAATVIADAATADTLPED